MRSNSFMRPPKDELVYKIGDRVEVFATTKTMRRAVFAIGYEERSCKSMTNWSRFNLSKMCILRMGGWFRITFYGSLLTLKISECMSQSGKTLIRLMRSIWTVLTCFRELTNNSNNIKAFCEGTLC